MIFISVLLPAYNAEAYLEEAIESILAQTYTNFELLLINDGSTDRTAEIAQSYTDPRIRYIENPQNIGLIATLNKGIGLAQGRYIARMDADDIALPERLAKQLAFMQANPKVGVCGTWFGAFRDDKSNLLKTVKYALNDEEIRIKHLHQIHLCHGTAMFRTSILRDHNLLFDPVFKHAEDYELWQRIGKHTQFANIPYLGYLVRHHEEEVSVKFSDIQQKNSWKIKSQLFEELGAPLSIEEYLIYEKAATAHLRPIKPTSGK